MAAPLILSADLLWELIEPLLLPKPSRPKGGRPRLRRSLPEFCLSFAVAFPGRCCHKNWVAAQP